MRIWEIDDSRAIPSDLVREQDFILRVRRLQRLGTPHLVVNIVLNAIEPVARSQRALEAAQKQLQEFAKLTSGTYAEMSNGDAFIVWEETADAQLLSTRLLAAVLPEGAAPDEAAKILLSYHMPRDYTPLRERTNHYVEVVHAASSVKPDPAHALKGAGAAGPLTAWSVDQIGKLLGDIDISRYTRSQPVYRRRAGGGWAAELAEHYISIDDLRRERFPKLDVITPEHLFLALCESLDQWLLAALTQNYDAIAGKRLNFNLSVASITGSVFAQFAFVVPRAARNLISFELHRGDLLLDFARTLNAVELLRREGFRVAIDSVTPDMLPYLNLAAFDADMIKINVSKDRAEQLAAPAVRKALAQLPADRLVFFRCDNEKALALGLEAGVQLFQGWLIDDLAGKGGT
jgi:EAL domain-containing protein (putative c-di-GMP-specific phosphodiesterase class I)